MPQTPHALSALPLPARVSGPAEQRSSHTDQSIAIACTRGREAVVRRFTFLLAQENFTEQQWRVMRILFDFEPIAMTLLCHRTCIHKVSMTRIVKTLEAKDLVERRFQEGNSKAFEIMLTDLGRQKMSRMTPIAEEIYDGIAADFGKEETAQLLALLDKLSRINDTD
ncbi:MarR family transcriptional regulator [Pseudooceanicola nanhaiensis]|uniref:MarR family transcriptional regulator n=1 Tax=Pseudooceanicola nanhaiensis TaxID=375761 RepID=UPI001CD56CBE|nr:MarR family transcriptional regulator [Pseudooceanicola nanhaiensis]MCA0921449.1 MarR family transcriptional regulator [Pseudooceanicola nanhaiensis]